MKQPCIECINIQREQLFSVFTLQKIYELFQCISDKCGSVQKQTFLDTRIHQNDQEGRASKTDLFLSAMWRRNFNFCTTDLNALIYLLNQLRKITRLHQEIQYGKRNKIRPCRKVSLLNPRIHELQMSTVHCCTELNLIPIPPEERERSLHLPGSFNIRFINPGPPGIFGIFVICHTIVERLPVYKDFAEVEN